MGLIPVLVDTQERVVILLWGLLALATLVTIVRLGLRWATQKRFHADDWYCLFAWICMVIVVSLQSSSVPASFWISDLINSQTYAAKNGLPPPVIDHKKYDELVASFALHHTVAVIFLWGSLWAGKLSMLSFYRRLMKNMGRFMIWWWIVLTVCVLSFLACFVGNFLACMPFSRRFTADRKVNCANPEATVKITQFFTFSIVVDIVTDFMIMILPLPLIARLHVSWLKKLGLIFIFCLGSFMITIAAIRLVALRPSYAGYTEYLVKQITIWNTSQVCVSYELFWAPACVVISLPALPALRRFIKCRTSRRYPSFVGKSLNKFSFGSGSRGHGHTQDDGSQGTRVGGHIGPYESELASFGPNGAVEGHTVDIDLEHLAGSSSREELRPIPEAHLADEHWHGKGITSPGDEQVSVDGWTQGSEV